MKKQSLSNLAIIDGTSLLYKSSWVNKDSNNFGLFTNTLRESINDILDKTKSDYYLFIIDASINWRKILIPSHKADRKDRYDKFLPDLRYYASNNMEAYSVDGIEADDLVGIALTQLHDKYNCIICHIDGDLNQLPGTHFNWDKGELYEVSEADAHSKLMNVLLLGGHNNEKGLPGCGPKTIESLLENNHGIDLFSSLNYYIHGISKEIHGVSRTVKGLGLLDGVYQFTQSIIQSYILRTQEEVDWALSKAGLLPVKINFKVKERGENGSKVIKF